MEFDWQTIIYLLFLLDSLGVILMSWFGKKWWQTYAGPVAVYFPPAKGWALLYFILILIIGYLLGIL